MPLLLNRFNSTGDVFHTPITCTYYDSYKALLKSFLSLFFCNYLQAAFMTLPNSVAQVLNKWSWIDDDFSGTSSCPVILKNLIRSRFILFMCRVCMCSVRIFIHQITWLNSEQNLHFILLIVTKDEVGFHSLIKCLLHKTYFIFQPKGFWIKPLQIKPCQHGIAF